MVIQAGEACDRQVLIIKSTLSNIIARIENAKLSKAYLEDCIDDISTSNVWIIWAGITYTLATFILIAGSDDVYNYFELSTVSRVVINLIISFWLIRYYFNLIRLKYYVNLIDKEIKRYLSSCS